MSLYSEFTPFEMVSTLNLERGSLSTLDHSSVILLAYRVAMN